MLDSVDKIPSMQGRVATGGRLNVARALARLQGQPDPPAPTVNCETDFWFALAKLASPRLCSALWSPPLPRTAIAAGPQCAMAAGVAPCRHFHRAGGQGCAPLVQRQCCPRRHQHLKRCRVHGHVRRCGRWSVTAVMSTLLCGNEVSAAGTCFVASEPRVSVFSPCSCKNTSWCFVAQFYPPNSTFT